MLVATNTTLESRVNKLTEAIHKDSSLPLQNKLDAARQLAIDLPALALTVPHALRHPLDAIVCAALLEVTELANEMLDLLDSLFSSTQPTDASLLKCDALRATEKAMVSGAVEPHALLSLLGVLLDGSGVDDVALHLTTLPLMRCALVGAAFSRPPPSPALVPSAVATLHVVVSILSHRNVRPSEILERLGVELDQITGGLDAEWTAPTSRYDLGGARPAARPADVALSRSAHLALLAELCSDASVAESLCELRHLERLKTMLLVRNSAQQLGAVELLLMVEASVQSGATALSSSDIVSYLLEALRLPSKTFSSSSQQSTGSNSQQSRASGSQHSIGSPLLDCSSGDSQLLLQQSQPQPGFVQVRAAVGTLLARLLAVPQPCAPTTLLKRTLEALGIDSSAPSRPTFESHAEDVAWGLACVEALLLWLPLNSSDEPLLTNFFLHAASRLKLCSSLPQSAELVLRLAMLLDHCCLSYFASDTPHPHVPTRLAHAAVYDVLPLAWRLLEQTLDPRLVSAVAECLGASLLACGGASVRDGCKFAQGIAHICLRALDLFDCTGGASEGLKGASRLAGRLGIALGFGWQSQHDECHANGRQPAEEVMSVVALDEAVAPGAPTHFFDFCVHALEQGSASDAVPLQALEMVLLHLDHFDALRLHPSLTRRVEEGVPAAVRAMSGLVDVHRERLHLVLPATALLQLATTWVALGVLVHSLCSVRASQAIATAIVQLEDGLLVGLDPDVLGWVLATNEAAVTTLDLDLASPPPSLLSVAPPALLLRLIRSNADALIPLSSELTGVDAEPGLLSSSLCHLVHSCYAGGVSTALAVLSLLNQRFTEVCSWEGGLRSLLVLIAILVEPRRAGAPSALCARAELVVANLVGLGVVHSLSKLCLFPHVQADELALIFCSSSSFVLAETTSSDVDGGHECCASLHQALLASHWLWETTVETAPVSKWNAVRHLFNFCAISIATANDVPAAMSAVCSHEQILALAKNIAFQQEVPIYRISLRAAQLAATLLVCMCHEQLAGTATTPVSLELSSGDLVGVLRDAGSSPARFSLLLRLAGRVCSRNADALHPSDRTPLCTALLNAAASSEAPAHLGLAGCLRALEAAPPKSEAQLLLTMVAEHPWSGQILDTVAKAEACRQPTDALPPGFDDAHLPPRGLTRALCCVWGCLLKRRPIWVHDILSNHATAISLVLATTSARSFGPEELQLLERLFECGVSPKMPALRERAMRSLRAAMESGDGGADDEAEACFGAEQGDVESALLRILLSLPAQQQCGVGGQSEREMACELLRYGLQGSDLGGLASERD